MDNMTKPSGPAMIGAYEAKTKFSQLIARAEKGESFVVTKNGRPVVRIVPMVEFDREKARKAAGEPSLVVSADGGAQHRWVVHVIDLAKQQGIMKFAINVQAE